MNIDARSAGPPLTMPRTIRLVEAKLVPSNRPQATPRKSKIKYAAAAALLRSEGLWSLGTILLGNRVFMDRSAGVFPWHALSRCPGRLFPQEACSNASWQKSLISEPSGLVQADLTDDRVMMQCRRSRSMDRSAGVFPWHDLSRCPGRLFPQEACSNASWQKSLISEPSGLVQADLTDDRVMMQCRRSRSVAAVLSSLFPE
jgi:hypothetical protein